MDITEIVEAAMISMKRGNRRGAVPGNVDNILIDLENGLNAVCKPSKRLVVDDIVRKRPKDGPGQNQGAEDFKNQFHGRFHRDTQKYASLPKPSDESVLRFGHLNDDLVSLIIDNQEDSGLNGNIWAVEEEHACERNAEELLRYDSIALKYSALKADEPVLQAHSLARTGKRGTLETKSVKKIPDRLLPQNINPKFRFDFEKIFGQERDNAEIILPGSDGDYQTTEIEGKYRSLKSITSKPVPKDYILDNEKAIITGIEFNSESNLAADLVGEVSFNKDANLNRYKEVEELYHQIMASMDDSKVEKEDGFHFLIQMPR
jgi:hypothetical protein